MKKERCASKNEWKEEEAIENPFIRKYVCIRTYATVSVCTTANISEDVWWGPTQMGRKREIEENKASEAGCEVMGLGGEGV